MPCINNQANRKNPFRFLGFTLIEVLIATTLTLLMMAALAQGFKRLSDAMTEGRAKLVLSDKLRSVTMIMRSDLENMTLRPNPNTGALEGSGYFEYYDGPCNDYYASTYNYVPTAGNVNQAIATSRFGDVDDILSFTVRSRTEPFRGKVPRAILKASQGLPIDNSLDWDIFDSISSEYAEIIYFLQPKMFVDTAGNLVNLTTMKPNVVDTKNAGFPDEYTLFRRVLLIRPDLNVPFMGVISLPNNGIVPKKDSVTGKNIKTGLVCLAGVDTDSMAMAHQMCDLSIRRVSNGVGKPFDPVAANSLEDLARRENRFAHFVIPSTYPHLVSYGLSTSCSVPILGLTHPVVGAFPTTTLPLHAGFLHPSFVLQGARAGEDVLMAGATAFDLRGYDPSAPLFYHSGNDGVAGSTGTAPILGEAGSDDLVLSPNDPGYPLAITGGMLASRGDFVDLGWGFKVINRATQLGVTLTAAQANNLVTPLSLMQSDGEPADSLFRSGLCVKPVGGTTLIYQPTFDSWSNSYESDGHVQGEMEGTSNRGGLWINGLVDLGYFASPGDSLSRSADRFVNGIDDASTDYAGGSSGFNGRVDDDLERELPPPINYPMRAIQIIVRAEDAGTSVLHQMSIIQDFLTQ